MYIDIYFLNFLCNLYKSKKTLTFIITIVFWIQSLFKKNEITYNWYIIIVSLLKVQSDNLISYSIQNNYDVNKIIALNWLIDKHNFFSRINCLTTCNRNSSCLNLVYNLIDGTSSHYSNEYFSTCLIQTSNSDFFFTKNRNFQNTL